MESKAIQLTYLKSEHLNARQLDKHNTKHNILFKVFKNDGEIEAGKLIWCPIINNVLFEAAHTYTTFCQGATGSYQLTQQELNEIIEFIIYVKSNPSITGI